MTQNVNRVKLAMGLRPQRDLLQTVLAGIDQHDFQPGPRAIDQSLITRHCGVHKDRLLASLVEFGSDTLQNDGRTNRCWLGKARQA